VCVQNINSMAEDMGTELDTQAEQIDRIDVKVDITNQRLKKQTKDMRKLM